MRSFLKICGLSLLLAESASADDRCRPVDGVDPCIWALGYADKFNQVLPAQVDEFGLSFLVLDASAEGPRLTVNSTIALSDAEAMEFLASQDLTIAELVRLVQQRIQSGVCQAPEGRIFLTSGGLLEVLLTSADGREFPPVLVQDCLGS